MSKKKLGIVVQRAGKDIVGGAEAHSLAIAGLMSEDYDVDIITTCAKEYTTWENIYSEGIEQIDGFQIKRFKVDFPRNIEKFNKYSEKLFSDIDNVSVKQCEKWMSLQGPYSTALLDYLENESEQYEKIIFFTYLYATTYFGLPLVKDKAILAPLAHDELPIYLPCWDSWFLHPSSFIFNTIEEKNFLMHKFPEVSFNGDIIGVGVNVPQTYSHINFRQKYDIYAPYILYIGRIDENKGCGELFDFFIKMKDSGINKELKLVLAGKNIIDIPKRKDIVYLGFIEDQTKYDAIAGCEFLINPSPFESLSMVLLESWAIGKPTLVTAKCDVMVGQTKRSKGGLYYNNYTSFIDSIEKLINNDYANQDMKDFVVKNYAWEAIKNKIISALEGA